tara:strand:- start:898 stop:1020 length:123 start_codon:yes stop_codon:yes gene_type:complete
MNLGLMSQPSWGYKKKKKTLNGKKKHKYGVPFVSDKKRGR